MMLSATDRAALTDLVHRYAAGVDDRQFESVVKLFTDTAELTVPDPPSVLNPVHLHRGERPSARRSPQLPPLCAPRTRSSARFTTPGRGPTVPAAALRASRTTGADVRIS
jgi:SnoaL-like protein